MPSQSHFFIVVPSFNQGDYIEQTLNSIVTQAGVKVTCLVRDGGSTDRTVSILKQFGSQISYVSRRDKGQSDAINQGLREVIKLSKKPDRDVFAYLNSDDYYLPEALKSVADALASDSRAWVVGDCVIVDQKGQSIQPLIRWYKKMARHVLFRQLLFILNPIPQPAVFMKVSAARQCGLFNQHLRYTMDYEYWLRLWQHIGPPLKLNQPLAAFRIHQSSKGSTSFTQQFAEQLQVTKQFTQNPAWLFGQRLHNKLITLIYQIVK